MTEGQEWDFDFFFSFEQPVLSVSWRDMTATSEIKKSHLLTFVDAICNS